MPMTPETRTAIRRLEVTSRRLLAGTLGGEYRSHFRGQGMEFVELRPYQPGDDVRTIDWNVTARTGTPHLRLYREERSRTLTLLADLSPSCTPAKRELLLQTAALLVFAAEVSRDRLALVAFSDRVERLLPPAGGRNHALHILGELATLQPAGRGTELRPALEAALALNRRPGLFILLSDLHAPLPEDLLRRTRARHDLLALVLRDSRECDLPAAGLIRMRDAESGRERLLDCSSSRSRAALVGGWQRADRETGDALLRLGVDHVFLRVPDAPLPPLLRLFRGRRRRRG